jgi:hypothetical protein
MPSAAQQPLDEAETALRDLLQALSSAGYHFVTPTDATHRRILRRPRELRPADLRDVFGWNRTFAETDVPGHILSLMRRGRILRRTAIGLRSRVRVSTLGSGLFLHTAFPTHAKDAVFFGPDTYRFARFLRRQLIEPALEGRLVDVGAGCGAGGLTALAWAPRMSLVLTDINRRALRLARINASHAGTEAELVVSAGLDAVAGHATLIIANPPYIAGRPGQTYQHGGDMHGTRMAASWATQATAKLERGGRMLLYTGAPILRGEDPLKAELIRIAKARSCDLSYQELDPDVFGEELCRPAYANVERIAVIGAVITRR